jgi:hypothetical protein
MEPGTSTFWFIQKLFKKVYQSSISGQITTSVGNLYVSVNLLTEYKETVYPQSVCLSMENIYIFVDYAKKKLALQRGMNKLSLYNREPHLSS